MEHPRMNNQPFGGGFNGEIVLCQPPNGEGCLCTVHGSSLSETLIHSHGYYGVEIQCWVPTHWIKPMPTETALPNTDL